MHEIPNLWIWSRLRLRNSNCSVSNTMKWIPFTLWFYNCFGAGHCSFKLFLRRVPMIGGKKTTFQNGRFSNGKRPHASFSLNTQWANEGSVDFWNILLDLFMKSHHWFFYSFKQKKKEWKKALNWRQLHSSFQRGAYRLPVLLIIFWRSEKKMPNFIRLIVDIHYFSQFHTAFDLIHLKCMAKTEVETL